MDHSLHLVSLVRPQGIRKLLQRAPDELRLLPQVGRQESVGVGDGGERGLQGVLERLGRASGRCVGILNTSELQETLDGWGGDKGSTAGRGDELEVGGLANALPMPAHGPGAGAVTHTDSDGATLSRLLDGNGVGLTKVGTPISSSHGDDAQLGDDDGGTDGGGDLLGSLDAEADVALGVANDDNGLESGSLTGTGLLLDGLDLFGGEARLALYGFGTSASVPPARSSNKHHEHGPPAGEGPPRARVTLRYQGSRGGVIHGAGGRGMLLGRTFMTSSLSLGRKKSTIWYSLMGRECR